MGAKRFGFYHGLGRQYSAPSCAFVSVSDLFLSSSRGKENRISHIVSRAENQHYPTPLSKALRHAVSNFITIEHIGKKSLESGENYR